MIGEKFLRLGLAVMLAVSLLALGTMPVSASDRLVDQEAEVDLLATSASPVGAEGEAELELRIDADGTMKFEAKADAEGLIGGVTYTLFVGGMFIASEVADADGSVDFDGKLDSVGFITLLGLDVTISDGSTIVLAGMVTEVEEEEIEEIEEEEEID